MSWLPVYYSKQTEEERKTLTKTCETVTRKKVQTPGTHYMKQTKASESLLDKENWKSSGREVVTTTMTIQQPDIEHSDSFFEGLFKDGLHRAEPARVIPENSPPRSTYRDWKNLREKLLKDFEHVGRKKVEEVRGEDEKIFMGFKEPVRVVRYADIVPVEDKCKQQEDRMARNLDEIHALVEDVKNLSDKFPKIFRRNSDKMDKGHTSSRGDITYISGIAFKINPKKFLN